MDDREQIIRLGKCLAGEARAGYTDAAAGGLDVFLERWRAESNGAAQHPTVGEVLERLTGYSVLAQEERQERIDRSLAELRALFKTAAPASSVKEPPAPRPPATPRPVATRHAAPQLQPGDQLTAVPGVGPAMAKSLARLGLQTVEDMLYHFPHRYDDYSSRETIAGLAPGMAATIVGEIVEIKTFTTRTNMQGVNLLLNDDTGVLQVSFFGQKWLAQQL
ncbi:MAG: DNA helicase RecG, partial [Chloroflexota bacterium]|nr:DNA helicase RecG [Chloroflexota bacterium]